MKPKLLIAIALSAGILAGCQTGTTTSGVSNSSGTAQQTPTPPPPVVPAELKNDAYSWYGLANDKPMKVTLSTSGTPPTTGTQTIHLVSVADGKAVFELTRDGDLGTKMGSETLSLEKDGLYTIKGDRVEGDIHNLELPAKLEPGVTFKNSGKDIKMKDANGVTQDFGQDETFTVVGPAKVTTPVATQDALLITSTGSMTAGGRTLRMDTKIWYVKDKGIVKSVVTMKDAKDPKAQKQEITIQEAK